MSRHRKSHKHRRKDSKKKQRDRSASTSSIASDHSEDNALRPKSSRRASSSRRGSNVRSVPPSAGASSSTSPPPPFSGPTGVNKIQIRRKTRWGPTLEGKTQSSRTDAKKKRRKESNGDFRGKKNTVRPLLDFVDNRKQLASEVLSSLDVRTRNRIFPELKGMLEQEATALLYGYLKGISRKRIMALMQSENLSNSSSTSESDDNLYAFPSTSSDQQNQSSPATNANPTPACKHPTKSSRLLKETLKRAGAKKFKMARRMEKGNGGEELEEGEVRSSAEEEDKMKNGNGSIPTVYNDKRRDNTTDGDEGEADEDDTFVHVAPSVDGTELNGRNEHVHHQQFKPQFVISLNCSPPPVESESVGDVHDDESDFGEFEQQRIVCILPPSPTASVVVGIHSDDHHLSDDDDNDDRQQQKSSIDYCQMEHSLQVQITVSDEEAKEEGVLGHVEATREPDWHAGRRITLYDKTPEEEEDEEPDIELIE